MRGRAIFLPDAAPWPIRWPSPVRLSILGVPWYFLAPLRAERNERNLARSIAVSIASRIIRATKINNDRRKRAVSEGR